MESYNSPIESIYNHPIFKSLLKNEVTLYGCFIREILYENVSINEYINYQTNNKMINCYARTVYKEIIERDLDEYIIDRIQQKTNLIVVFELAAPFDLAGIRVPRKLVSDLF